jgi:hypothetical protein
MKASDFQNAAGPPVGGPTRHLPAVVCGVAGGCTLKALSLLALAVGFLVAALP